MEGIITCLLGIAGYFLIVPFPDQEAWKSKGFLTQREVEYVMAIVDQDRGDAHTEPFTLGRFLRPALQPKVWGFAMQFLCTTTMVSPARTGQAFSSVGTDALQTCVRSVRVILLLACLEKCRI